MPFHKHLLCMQVWPARRADFVLCIGRPAVDIRGHGFKREGSRACLPRRRKSLTRINVNADVVTCKYEVFSW